MPAAGGTNGTCTSTSSSDTAGRSAHVHFDGPPPHDEVYGDLSADEFLVFNTALAGGAKVDTTCDAGGSVTGCTAHKP